MSLKLFLYQYVDQQKSNQRANLKTNRYLFENYEREFMITAISN